MVQSDHTRAYERKESYQLSLLDERQKVIASFHTIDFSILLNYLEVIIFFFPQLSSQLQGGRFFNQDHFEVVQLQAEKFKETPCETIEPLIQRLTQLQTSKKVLGFLWGIVISLLLIVGLTVGFSMVG